jgi:GxxExxY protein
MAEIVNEKYIYSALTGKIIGCAMEVHKLLGNGFQEVIYQRALEEEFAIQKVPAKREFEMYISYKQKIVGTRRVDFFVDEAVSVEIKALTKLEDVHLTQAINYLEAYNLEIGMLINFGAKSLEYKRLINPKFDPIRGNTSIRPAFQS